MTVIRPEWETIVYSINSLSLQGRGTAAKRQGEGVRLALTLPSFAWAPPSPLQGEGLLVRAPHIGLLVDVDDDPGAGPDMRRHHHAHAVLEQSRLVAGRGRLALHHRVRLDDRRLDRVGELDRDRPFLPKLHDHVHSVLKEGGGVAEEVRGERDLLVILLVHEGQLV